ncbi:uncharacterized protein B0H18DRAFT_1177255 [Fomitopsis serialis]|uniref:uncharacterized protein n=1 Tax=Fomitopsis serialis TaxID=139415 RepID=UPI00200823E9|nr:uncharacterized protein B0H18DRAFT_1177255 [Neoantrodia serialis]KAH9924055.1 hypothetical protein B0H18DRAFT_1177255 [Neoantrodia serialis]
MSQPSDNDTRTVPGRPSQSRSMRSSPQAVSTGTGSRLREDRTTAQNLESGLLSPPLTASLIPAAAPELNAGSLGDYFGQLIHDQYPNLKVEDNFSKFTMLANGGYPGGRNDSQGQVDAWLSSNLQDEIQELGCSEEEARETIEESLHSWFSQSADVVTGMKPQQMETDPGSGIVVKTIPDTDYFIRQWRGNPEHHEVCFDYLTQDESGQRRAINCPAVYELWLAPNAAAASPGQLLPSLEQSIIELQGESIQIRPGEEKWVLKEGMSYQVRTRLHPDIPTDIGPFQVVANFTATNFFSRRENVQYSGPQI